MCGQLLLAVSAVGISISVGSAISVRVACAIGVALTLGLSVTVLTIWILLHVFSDCLGNLTITLEVFPEDDLVVVDHHLILRTMQFTAELDE